MLCPVWEDSNQTTHVSTLSNKRVSLIIKLGDKERDKYGEVEHCTGSIDMRILTVYTLTRIYKSMIRSVSPFESTTVMRNINAKVFKPTS